MQTTNSEHCGSKDVQSELRTYRTGTQPERIENLLTKVNSPRFWNKFKIDFRYTAMNLFTTRGLIATTLSLCMSTILWGSSEHLASDLRGKTGSEMVDVIVQYRNPPTEAQHNKIAGKGGTLQHRLDLIGAGHYQVPASALADLANDPDVAYVSPDRPVKGQLDSAEPAINANVAFANGYTGKGIAVAVIDSGISSGDDVSGSRIVYNQSFVSTDLFNQVDRYGHGTHVAGIIGGNAADSHRLKLYQDVSWHRAGRESGQPPRVGSEWRRHRQPGDCRHPGGHQTQENLQHRRDQPLAGPPGVRILQARSSLPSRRSCMESGNRGSSGGRQRRPR